MGDPKKIKLSPATFARTGLDRKIIRTLGEYGQNLAASPNEFAIANVIALVIGELEQKPAPEAYMGYALYDADSNMYEQGKVVLSKKARNKHEELIEKIAVKKDGYIETFLVNETSENVWFDQFRIQSTGPLIVQETHYDPWGLELTGLGYQYGGIKVNRYLYNGKEFFNENDINIYDYGARMYDPTIGRWSVVDPLAELAHGLTPYRYAFNNPVRVIDPNGMFEYVKGGYGENIEVGSVWSHSEDGGYLSNKKNKEENKPASNAVVSVNKNDQNQLLDWGNCPSCNQSEALNPILIPIIAAAEEILIALGVATGVAYHANDKRSRKDNYVYEIRSYGINSRTGQPLDYRLYKTEKYGISSDNGERVRRQVNKLNQSGDGRIYDYMIIANQIPGRFEALVIEKFYVTMYAVRNNGDLPRMQFSPLPW